MKIFISHPIADEHLAIELKSLLETSADIEIAHIAQKEKDFEIEIAHKILKQIDESDYLVALITTNSVHSASVNQELGYSQGTDLKKIPLIEESAKKGFLIYGKDSIDFTRKNFSEKCKEVLKYILDNPVNNNSRSFNNETQSLEKNNFQLTQDELLKSKFPESSNPSIRLTAIPIDATQSLIEFNPENYDWFKSYIPQHTKISSVKLNQNEIHYENRNFPATGTNLLILNEYACFSGMEFINNYEERLHKKSVIISRQLVFLKGLLEYVKAIYDKFNYAGRVYLKLELHSIQLYSFQGYDVNDPFHENEKQFLKSDVIIEREIAIPSWNLRNIMASLFDEMCKSCDWVLDKSEIYSYFDYLKSKGYPIE